MTLEVRLDRHQRAALKALVPGWIITLAWGRGSGKSVFLDNAIHYLALQEPRHIGLIMPELKQARNTHWVPRLFGQFANDLSDYITGPPNKTNLSVEYRNGSRLSTWGAENAHGILGQRFDVIVQDETDNIDPAIEAAVIRPTFSRSGQRSIWLRAGTPRRGRHGTLYAGWEKAKKGEPGHVAFRVPSSDSYWVDQAWLAEVKRTTDPRIFKREYECDFDASEGLVYDLFDEDFHVREPPADIEWNDVLIGCDHGYEDPGVGLLIGIQGHGQDATAWVLEEIYENHKTEDWWCDKWRTWMKWYPQALFYGDPSQPALLQAYKKKAGVRLRGRRADNVVDNSLQDGIAAVAHRLMKFSWQGQEHARLYVSKRCPNIIREMGLYKRRPETRNAEDMIYTEDIVDKDNHCLAAGTMISTVRGQIPIERITLQDKVWTRRGLAPLAWSGKTSDSRATLILKTSSGHVLEGTPDHLVATSDGWKRLDALRYGDMLWACLTPCSKPLNGSSTTEPSTEDTQHHRGESSVSTSHLSTAGASTSPSGSIITGRSRQGITSTTRTRTPSTTRSTISSACRPETTSPDTSHQSCGLDRAPGPIRFVRSRWLGTEAQRAEPGILNTEKRLGRNESPSPESAKSATKHSTASRAVCLTGFARTSAGLGSVGRQESTTSPERVSNAGVRSRSTGTKRPHVVLVAVESVTESGRAVPVYDLTVDGPPEFFANGVLVHNCMDGLRYPIFNYFGPVR